MTGLFRDSLQAMSHDIREMNQEITDCMAEINSELRKLIEKREVK